MTLSPIIGLRLPSVPPLLLVQGQRICEANVSYNRTTHSLCPSTASKPGPMDTRGQCLLSQDSTFTLPWSYHCFKTRATGYDRTVSPTIGLRLPSVPALLLVQGQRICEAHVSYNRTTHSFCPSTASRPGPMDTRGQWLLP